MKALSLQTDDGLPPPVHIAIIMDGNGRWAQARGLPRTEGHRRGAGSVRRTVECAIASGVSYLTLFGFSSENWKRPASEVKDLMGLLRYYLKSEIKELDEQGVRLQVIGDRAGLAPDIVSLIEESEARTAKNSVLTLTVALNYGGRAEITAVARELARKVAAGELAADEIDEETFGRNLSTRDMPDPDLLIRTSGEQRISNFLLWQLAYSELVFVDTLWPEFSVKDFENAIAEYHGRERRYGAAGG